MVAHLTVDCVDIKSSQPLPTVVHNGTLYVVCNAGDEFNVRCTVHNATNSDHKVFLQVDGMDVGYTKIVYKSLGSNPELTFEGFLSRRGSGNQPSTYRAFKVGACKPAQDAAVVEHPDEIKAGRITVQLSEVVAVGKLDALIVNPACITDDAVKKKLPEGKKWFLAPGLKAEAGSVQSCKANWDDNRYEEVRKLPSTQLRYDSHEALLLRKVLNPSIAEHRAILRTCKDPRIAAMGNQGQECSNHGRQQPPGRQQAGAGGSRNGQTGAAVKREGIAGLKRELGTDEEPMPRSATAETVDLTGVKRAAGPLLVDGRALGPDELAVCDLCDSDGEAAPTWQVKKKRTTTIE